MDFMTSSDIFYIVPLLLLFLLSKPNVVGSIVGNSKKNNCILSTIILSLY